MLSNSSHGEKSISGLAIDCIKDGSGQKERGSSVILPPPSVSELEGKIHNKDPKGGGRIAVQLAGLLFAEQKPAN